MAIWKIESGSLKAAQKMSILSGEKTWANSLSLTKPKTLESITVVIMITAEDKMEVWRVVKMEKIFFTVNVILASSLAQRKELCYHFTHAID